jgi:hypothetical protein
MPAPAKGRLVRCEALSELLAEAAEGRPVQGRSARSHVEHCLRCQADLAQYRRLHRGLRSLADRRMTTPGDWIEELLAALDEQSTGSTSGRLRRAAVLGGMAAVTAAGAASVLVLSTRSRRRLAG